MYVQRNTEARSRIIVAVEKQYEYYLLVCVCMRARVCIHVGTRARGRVRVHVVLLIQHATCILLIVTSFVAHRSPPNFSTLSHKRCDFRENVIGHEMCVLIFTTTFF